MRIESQAATVERQLAGAALGVQRLWARAGEAEKVQLAGTDANRPGSPQEAIQQQLVRVVADRPGPDGTWPVLRGGERDGFDPKLHTMKDLPKTLQVLKGGEAARSGPLAWPMPD